MPRKKKILFLLIIGVMIIASFVIMDIYKPDKMVISYIKVIEKHNEDNKDYFIVGVNPHDPEAEPVKIYIKEKNVWNIVMVDQTYLATYDFISSNSYKLDEIKLPD
ncbi:hypothetical protein ACPV3A_17025 [Paenibacillus sp. Dod16]|uniref:hypothetical protein n=1 Tax=Paenibacillus sp. Dod16 TaxID=3416392 RepID=UPI003CF9DA73